MSAREAAVAGQKVLADVYIPTPETVVLTPAASRLYYAPFSLPTEYIKFSATVEETTGCPYTMYEVDQLWLNDWNKKHTGPDQVDETRFEEIMWYFEQYVERRDVSKPEEMSFVDMEKDMQENRASLISTATKEIFVHWQNCRRKHKGPLMPKLQVRFIVLLYFLDLF